MDFYVAPSSSPHQHLLSIFSFFLAISSLPFISPSLLLPLISLSMGHKFSAVHGVKSGNFYHQGNAINEIWLGDVELVSRLPFGDSDLGQAGWPEGSWPKIPWHQFIIPLKRSVEFISNNTMATNETMSTYPQTRDSIWVSLFGDWFEVIPLDFLLGVLLVSFGLYLLFVPLHFVANVVGTLSFYRQLGVRVSCPGWIESRIKSCVRLWALVALCAIIIGPIVCCVGLYFMSSGLQRMTAAHAIANFVLIVWCSAMCSLALTSIFLVMKSERVLAVNRQSTNEKLTDDNPVVALTADEFINLLEDILGHHERKTLLIVFDATLRPIRVYETFHSL